MDNFITRHLLSTVKKRLKNSPAVALLGPRQCGKSTLARHIISNQPATVYLDLENSSDFNKLRDVEAFFAVNPDKLVCLDEIQLAPELFSSLRSIIDRQNRNGQLLLLGSASRDLLQQSSESLAGRISYLELTPFLLNETGSETLLQLWLKGGFPRSFLNFDQDESFGWRKDFIRTFLERDIPQLGFSIPAKSIERLWRMCAHSHGAILNSSKIGTSLGVSNHTVRSYIDILEATFLIRTLEPYEANIKKRLVKSPKIYIRDSGLLHTLLDINSHNDLLGHPIYGSSWEGFALENILSMIPQWKASFYRTQTGVELDLILTKGEKKIAVEFKASHSPKPTKGFFTALKDLEINEAYIVCPIKDIYPIENGIKICGISEFLQTIN
ncbi:MAG: ATP-binding protein [Deltaproteobacteria bacterium]|nr:ATP-binding protein [Deltaproteobacteria bacterium]